LSVGVFFQFGYEFITFLFVGEGSYLKEGASVGVCAKSIVKINHILNFADIVLQIEGFHID
jgi:hypothetical protein